MKLLTVDETAKQIAMSPSTVRSLCDRGALVAVRPSGNPRGARRITAESVQAYIASLVQHRPEALTIVEPELDDSEQKMREIANRLRKARKEQPA